MNDVQCHPDSLDGPVEVAQEEEEVVEEDFEEEEEE